jgi:hypothetical protein
MWQVVEGATPPGTRRDGIDAFQVSRIVNVGSDVVLEGRGAHPLEGGGSPWPLFAVARP